MPLKQIWKQVLLRLKPTLRSTSFVTWFADTAMLDHLEKENKVVIGVPTPFALNWVQKHYDVKVTQAIQEILPEVQHVEYTVQSSLSNQDNTDSIDIKTLCKPKTVRKAPNKNEVIVNGNLRSRKLNVKYSLYNFIVGESNRLPHTACKAVGTMPGGIYNPLYVFSDVGLGKTHLLQATANEVLANRPDAKVVYVTAEQFTNEVINAISKRRTKQLKDKYRTVDCLIIDDIQFLQNKEHIQMELFHTFNDLYDHNKQIVLSSDTYPKDLKGFADRLRGRFAMGTVVEIAPPDYETRLSILRQRCTDLGVLVDPDVLELIARKMNGNIRDLIGVLMQTISFATLNDLTPDLKIVRQVLNRQNKIHSIHKKETSISLPVQKKAPNLDGIVGKVSDYYGLETKELFGTVRKKEIALARQICMYLIKKELNYSYERIGKAFGGRNHSTVLHAYNSVLLKLKEDFRVVRDINFIKGQLGF